MRKQTLPVLLCLLCFSSAILAEDRGLSNYYFSRISVENGLSESNVKAIVQDSYGFIWFGTKNGLNRFDGTSIVQKDCDDYIAGTGNHNISALFEDKDSILWVGTDRGVYQYNPVSDIFTAVNLKTKEAVDMNNWVSNIVADSVGNIWVVIPDQGVFRYKDKQLYYYKLTNQENLKTEAPDCICVRANGEVWVGAWGVGLFRYNDKTDRFEHYIKDKTGRSLQGKNINAICDYGDWIAMAIQEGEVMKYNPTTDELLKISLLEASKTVVRNLMFWKNELWVGTNEGMFIINESKNRVIHLLPDLMRPFSLSDKIIYTLYRDRDDGVWLGTMFGGVNYLPNRDMVFEKYVPGSDANSLSTKRVREIASDDSGNVWIGTEDGGINMLDIATGKVKQVNYNIPGGKNHLITLSMSVYNNQVYCGLFKQGMDVVQLPGGGIKHYTPEQLGIGEGSVYSFFIDSRGERWIGTGWGLCKAAPGWLAFSRVDTVGYDWIFDIFEDSDGILWFATMGSGLWKYTPSSGSFKKYIYEKGQNNTLSSNSISSIMQDSRGSIWLSTDRGGICCYNLQSDNFTAYSVQDGLPDDVSYKILEDEKHNLWFGTNRGLVCFNPDTKYVRTYTTKDGLLGNQFSYKSALKGKDGKFYFGGIEGLIAFDPNSSEVIHSPYPLYITKFSIDNQEVTVHTANHSPITQSIIHTDKIILPHDQSNISFDVALLSYSTTAANQYYYIMEPLDKDWIKAASNRNISFTKLPPGDYTFTVRATDGRNGSLYASRTLSIVILPPWWKSALAYMLYVLCGIAAVLCWFLWYRRHKDKQMEERQKLFEIEKEKELYESKISFFTAIAHEIRTPLTLINGPMEAINEMNISEPKLNKNLSVIGQNTKRLLDLAGQLLDFQKIGAEKFDLKFENVDITILLNETMARFEPTILQKKKELLRNIPDRSIIAAIDREAVTKILSNLLNNALKYARQTILVELSKDETTFTVHVVSDGEKISPELGIRIFEPFYQIDKKRESRQGVGIGLPLARSLALLHKGSLYLDPEQSDNTFVLTIPINEEKIREETEKTVQQDIVTLDEESSLETDENMKGYTLLLVEDNEDMLLFIQERLEEYFTVETAHNGYEALEVLRSNHIDLVISDIMMPVMNGYELCKTIKADINLCHIPVIFLTAKNDLESKINGLKFGAEAYVEKPFSFNYLKTQVLSLLSNRRIEWEAFSKRPFFPVHNMQMNKGDEEFANRVIKEIQSNITNINFGVERMAEDLGMSRSNLLRKIKNLFNLSPVDFICLIRLKKAAELIQEGKFRIGDICYMVGINSPSYFGKLFLKQFGMTPKEFEKQNGEINKKYTTRPQKNIP